jgi:hypothetical protein
VRTLYFILHNNAFYTNLQSRPERATKHSVGYGQEPKGVDLGRYGVIQYYETRFRCIDISSFQMVKAGRSSERDRRYGATSNDVPGGNAFMASRMLPPSNNILVRNSMACFQRTWLACLVSHHRAASVLSKSEFS